jgi:DNA polymerase III subunit beta
MKLSFDRVALTDSFGLVAGVAPSRTTKEILKNVKVVTTGGGNISLTATDGEIGIRCEVAGSCDAVGVALLPSVKVMAILKELKGDTITLEFDDRAVKIECGQSAFTLQSEDPSDFPDVAAWESNDSHAIAADVLRTMIQRTIFCTDEDSTRYALAGIQIGVEPGATVLASTDSRRLAVASFGNQISDNPTEAVVPAKAMQVVFRSLVNANGDAEIAIRPNDAMFRFGGITIVTQLTQGRFPNYRKVVPDNPAIKINLLVGPLLSAVRQSMIVTNEESRGVDFVFESEWLKLNSQATDIGKSKIEVPIAYDGDPITITFDPRYISDFLRVIDPTDMITFGVTDADSSSLMTFGDDYKYVVMPLAKGA